MTEVVSTSQKCFTRGANHFSRHFTSWANPSSQQCWRQLLPHPLAATAVPVSMSSIVAWTIGAIVNLVSSTASWLGMSGGGAGRGSRGKAGLFCHVGPLKQQAAR